jgi:hypothetical protein
MPETAGQTVNLTVSDVGRSAAWSCDVLGMEEISRYAKPGGHVALAHLAEPRSGLELCLVAQRSAPTAGSISC